ncbi:MAG: ATP-dependent zinc metalloprotease FtsH [Defluviitaleaceae bacterium]|nr:ATP-dependent zinc metalloprotease FtsH [Defluviitaleaceae bacterium]
MNDKGSDSPQGRKPGGFMMILITALLVTFFINMLLQTLFSGSIIRIPYSEFLELVQIGYVERVEVQPDRLIITMQEGYIPGSIAERSAAEADSTLYESDVVPTGPFSFLDQVRLQTDQRLAAQAPTQVHSGQYYTGWVENPELVSLLTAHGVEFSAPVSNNNVVLDIVLQWVIPLLIIYGLSMLLFRSLASKMGGRGGFMSIGQSNAKMYMEKKTGVTFGDVAGQEEAKESLTEIVDFLHNPDKYTEIGAKQPKGALLVGPPGTGKTLLAKAVAGEANVAFFSLSGSDFVEMFVGVGASRVRDLFKQANQHAPCIIFIDEIDAIGKSRDNQIGSNDEREQTLNQLLSEMDGFDSSKGVVILGATNRPEILDKALLRPGRFDRRINVELPDLKGREDILQVHAKKVKMGASVQLRKIALATPGAAGADLANMINEAALRAVRLNRKEVAQEDLMEAVEIIIAGKEKKDRIMSEKEKRIVAYHEVGHALATALAKNAQPVQKITIVPRTKGALGYTMYLPEEEKYLSTKDEMLDRITTLLAGRAAESIVFDVETTGAADDIQRATKMARSMVSLYGMSEKFGLMSLESVESKYLDGRNVLTCSEQTGAELDKEVNTILQECYRRALDLLKEYRKKMDQIAEYLFEKETINGEEFTEILKNDFYFG